MDREQRGEAEAGVSKGQGGAEENWNRWFNLAMS